MQLVLRPFFPLFLQLMCMSLVLPLLSITFSHRTNDYATHQPVLYEIAVNTTGPVIEPLVNYEEPGTFDLSDVFRDYKIYYPLKPWRIHSGPPTLLGSDIDPHLPDIDFEQY
jgi:hypothetical protein